CNIPDIITRLDRTSPAECIPARAPERDGHGRCRAPTASRSRTMNDVGTASLPSGARSPTIPFFELSRLMVVATLGSTGRLVYKAQPKPNGPWEANWTPIDTTHTYAWMAAGVTGDGRVAAVAQRTSGGLGISYIDEAPDAVNVQRWSPPVDLGKPAAANG